MSEADDVRSEIADSLRRGATLVKLVVIGFTTQGALLIAILVGVVLVVTDTNRAVERQVIPLQERIVDLEEQVSDLEDINQQAVDEVVRLATLLQTNGIDPGTIRIEPGD